MPTLRQHWEQYTINEMVTEQLNYDCNVQHAFWESHHQLLNDEQRNTHERILHSVENGIGGMFMIHGHGGTRKTFLYKVICSRLHSKGTIILCTVSSGIAALLLLGGHTAHSMFKIPIDSLSPKSVCCIPKNSMWADLMQAVKCIIG